MSQDIDGPVGPDERGQTIWICGNCHVGNLGPLADAEDEVVFQIRDVVDQAVPGNPAHDLVRLGLSLCAEARSSNLPGLAIAALLEALADGYREGLLRLGAPPWLWTVVVDLLGRHERGYLAHCREYVLAARG